MKHKVILRKLLLSVSTVGLLGITLSVSTYAWFKLNSKASVEELNFSVIGGKGFHVSVDGGTYTNNLSASQIKKAIATKLYPAKYELGYEVDSNNEIVEGNVLYEISYDDNNEKIKTKVQNVDDVLNSVLKNIQLLPTTTKEGRVFTDLYNAQVSAVSGRYVEFGVYFKTTSTEKTDKLKYDIYLDGYDGPDENGNQIVPTRITSVTTKVSLVAPMNTYEYVKKDNIYDKQLINRQAGDIISVYSSNALRISTTSSDKAKVDSKYELTKNLKFVDGKKYYITNDDGDTFEEAEVKAGEEVTPNTYYEFIDESYTYNVDESSSLIYELNDTVNTNTDLGSYATDYDEVFEEHTDEYYLHSSKCNAMYTYYNNLRQNTPLTAIKYGEQPTTIKSLPAKTGDEIKKADYNAITTIESGLDAKLVTFRFWLEGWDADCFDGLANSIDVRLSFGSNRVN